MFNLGPVVGKRPLVKFGGDLIAITSDGYVPVLQLLKTGRVGDYLAVSDTISSAVTEAVQFYGHNFGWQVVFHPEANWLLVNVPAGGSTFQHIMNTQTGAWCVFKGWEAICWARFKDKLFYGSSDGGVCQVDIGASDVGMAIRGDIITAYKYFRVFSQKTFSMIRGLVSADASVSYNLDVVTDFETPGPLESATNVVVSGSTWAGLTWANFKWPKPVTELSEWQTTDKQGTAVAARLSVSSIGARLSLSAIEVKYDVNKGVL